MGPIVATVMAALVGGGLAVGAGLGLVASQTATPDPVSQPLVTYGSR